MPSDALLVEMYYLLARVFHIAWRRFLSLASRASADQRRRKALESRLRNQYPRLQHGHSLPVDDQNGRDNTACHCRHGKQGRVKVLLIRYQAIRYILSRI